MAGFFLTPPRINKCCGGGGGTGRSGQPKQRIRDVSQYSEKKRKDGMTSDNLFSSRYRNRDTGEGGGRHIISSSFPRFLFFLCTCRCCGWIGTVFSFFLPTNRPLLFLFDDNRRGTKGRNNKLNRWTELSLPSPRIPPCPTDICRLLLKSQMSTYVSTEKRYALLYLSLLLPFASLSNKFHLISFPSITLSHALKGTGPTDRPRETPYFIPPPLLFLYPKAFPRCLNPPPFPFPPPPPP